MGEQLVRSAEGGVLDFSQGNQTLSISSDTPIKALEIKYRGSLTAQMTGYQMAQAPEQEFTHMLIYSLNPSQAQQNLSLIGLSSDFELLEIQAAFGDGQILTSYSVRTEQPKQFRVYPNFPNPFNPQTTIPYDLAQTGQTRIQVFDIQGREIRMLVDAPQSAGHYMVEWNGLTSDGLSVGTGVYFCRIMSGEQQAILKVMMLK